MKSLYYLSSISFCQVDLPILPALSRQFKLVYGLIVTVPSNNNIPLEEVENHCQVNNIELRQFRFTRRLRDVRIGMEFWTALKDIRKERPDVLYLTCQDVPILSLLCLTLSKRHTIVAIHDVKFHSKSKFAFLLKFSRSITISHFEFFHVFSKNQLTIFNQRHHGKKASMIPLSVGYYGRFEGIANNRRDDYNEVRFLFFGNILPYKGLKGLLQAVERLGKKHLKFRLTIAGQCDNWDEEYEPLINDASRVTKIIGFIDAQMIPALFSDAHYLVLPYTDATQSGPLMLAYRFGLPIIASDIDAFKENIEQGISGFLYKSADPLSLERVMETAITRDKSEYNSLLISLKKYVENRFSIEEISRQYVDMFMNNPMNTNSAV